MTRAEVRGDPEAAAGTTDDLEQGRESFAARAWSDAFEALSRADESAPLGAEDLELLATAAYMLGRDDDYQRLLERAHHAHLDEGDAQRAVRCAFWVGRQPHRAHGELGPALGWFGRGQRLLEREEEDSVERGYLLIPVLLGHVAEGDCEAAYAVASEAAEIAARFGDADLLALVVQEQGHALVRQGRAEEGLRLVDEVMVSVTAGELSPIVTGLVYCNTIAFCQSVYELRRAREWTAALTRWCELQPDMVAHTGRVPRAPRRDHGATGRLARRARGGSACRPAVRARAGRPEGSRQRALSGGRGASAARRARGGRGRVPSGEPERLGAPAGAGAVAAGPGERGGCRRRRSAG